MDRDQRPPRSVRPPSAQQYNQRQDETLPQFPDQAQANPFDSRPSLPTLPFDGSRPGGGNVSFQSSRPPRPERQRTMPSPYQNNQLAAGPAYDAEANEYDAGRVGRKKSLVRPDREKIEPGHRQYHYRNHVAQAEEEGPGRMGVMPSSTFSPNCDAYISNPTKQQRAITPSRNSCEEAAHCSVVTRMFKNRDSHCLKGLPFAENVLNQRSWNPCLSALLAVHAWATSLVLSVLG